jgi:hypothetical protein
MKPILIFFIGVVVMSMLFFLIRINIFDGEVVYVSGIQKEVIKAPISLSYFLGIGYTDKEIEGIESFRLLPTGYLMTFVLIIGLPALIAYRIHLGKSKKTNS